MSRRETMLTLARVAGYHDDAKTFTRLRIESRVSLPFLHEAWMAGQRAKAAGVKCPCRDCEVTS